jgi:hypothetical protein
VFADKLEVVMHVKCHMAKGRRVRGKVVRLDYFKL